MSVLRSLVSDGVILIKKRLSPHPKIHELMPGYPKLARFKVINKITNKIT
jgi:hypothetical protein